MSKDRKSKIVVLVGLIVVVIGLSVGFSAFSEVLTINSQVTVNPSASDFSLAFVANEDGTGTVVAPESDSGIASSAILDGTRVTGISLNLTDPGQGESYLFYVKNTGKYVAYLNEVVFNNNTCSILTNDPSTGATLTDAQLADAGLVSQACNGVFMRLFYDIVDGGASAIYDNYDGDSVPSADSSDISGMSLAPGESAYCQLYVAYASDAVRADGPFSVNVGALELHYSTVD